MKNFLSIKVNVSETTGAQKITIGYNFLVAPKTDDDQKFFEEIGPLEEIVNNPELRPLILHPVLSSFLYLKWIKLSFLFYGNVLFFFLLMLFFTLYIFYKYDIFWILSLIFLILMTFREAIQLYLSRKQYFSLMNLFECLLISMIWILLLGIVTHRILRALTFLSMAFSFLAVIGDLPDLSISTHMVILKKVFQTFFKSLALYSILLIGFALCFYSLFESKVRENDGFKNPTSAIIKTIVMFSGELEASNIDFNNYVDSLIFLFFIFLIPIVLLNLLNGLSVTDIFEIKAEGHLIDLCQKIHVLNRYERIIMSRESSPRWLKSIISIFPEFVQQGKIEIDWCAKGDAKVMRK